MAVANYIILRMDRAMDERVLTTEERWLRRTLKHVSLGLSSLQATIDRQRSRVRWIREGDANTKLFQAVAIGRRSKNFIPHIRHNNKLITDQQRKEEVFTEDFQQLLGCASTREADLNLD